MKTRFRILILAVALAVAGSAAASNLTLTAVAGDHDERVDGVDPCPRETSFLLGGASSETILQVGGNAWGCDSEWAASFRFDLDLLATGSQIDEALLIVRQTGYADDSSGFPYLGAFTFTPGDAPVEVPRADLTPETALDVLMPSSVNGDLQFDVTGVIQTLVDDAQPAAGLLLCGIYDESGYHDFIYVANTGSAYPPRLHIIYTEGAVPIDELSFDAVKSLYR